MQWIYEWFIFPIWRVLESTIWKDGKNVKHCWPKSSEICDCSGPGNLKTFSRCWLQWRNNYPGRENYCSKLNNNWKKEKKGKLKTKNLSKITTYIRWTRALSTISSRQNQSSASLKLRNYVFTKTWKLVIGISIWK